MSYINGNENKFYYNIDKGRRAKTRGATGFRAISFAVFIGHIYLF